MTSFGELTIVQLLAAHSAVIDELRRRGIVRSKNNPTGDYTEWLVAEKLGLTLERKSSKGFDAADANGVRYQIKGRRITPDNPSVQLSAIRGLGNNGFDFLIGVIFDANWNILYAAKIPHGLVTNLAAFRSHVNGHVMHLRRTIFTNPLAEDITNILRDK